MAKEKKINEAYFETHYNEIEWGEFEKVLNKREKEFLFWYVFKGSSANPNPIRHNACACALQAGYKKSMARKIHPKLKDKRIKDCIEYLETLFYKISAKNLLEISNKQDEARLNYDVRKYFDCETVTNEETGQTYTKLTLKPFTEWTEDMAMAVDGIEINQSGIANIKFANRDRERKLIKDRVDEINKTKDAEGFDIETTVDVIRENLNTAKISIKLKNENIRKNAENYIENGENQPDFD